jgi:hypothetical protein
MTSKSDLYLTILNLLKEGKNPTTISKQLNIPKQKISYYTRRLKQIGVIKKVGYGTWEVQHLTSNTLETLLNKSIRGHAFIWTIKNPDKVNWKQILDNNSIHYNLVRNSTPRIFIKGKKIWLGKKGIVIYETKSFYGNNAINSKRLAVNELLEVVHALEIKLGVRLPKYFKCAREHLGLIKNDLAIQVNKQGEKIHIRDDLEGEWMWIDDSESLGELETSNVKNNLGVQKWFNDMKRTNFQVTPTFLMERMNQVTNNQLIFADNMSSHIQAIQTLSTEVKRFNTAIDRLIEEVENLKNGKN